MDKTNKKFLIFAVVFLLFCSFGFLTEKSFAVPVPAISANDSDSRISLNQGDNLRVSVSLSAGNEKGRIADWWALANSPFGWYYYDLNNGWTPGVSVTYQRALHDIADVSVLNYANLPEGSYIFYFNVDLKADGSVTEDQKYSSSVEVAIGSSPGNTDPPNPSSLVLTLPVNAEDVIFANDTMTGIWPFGAKGGDHPEGHGGIDFQVSRGKPIIAVADGIVGSVADSVYSGEKSIAIFTGAHETYYTGYFVDIFVTKGQNVKQGQTIGTADYFNNSDTAWIHFGLFDKVISKDICPESFFTTTALSDLNSFMKSARYPDKDKYPNICN